MGKHPPRFHVLYTSMKAINQKINVYNIFTIISCICIHTRLLQMTTTHDKKNIPPSFGPRSSVGASSSIARGKTLQVRSWNEQQDAAFIVGNSQHLDNTTVGQFFVRSLSNVTKIRCKSFWEVVLRQFVLESLRSNYSIFGFRWSRCQQNDLKNAIQATLVSYKTKIHIVPAYQLLSRAYARTKKGQLVVWIGQLVGRICPTSNISANRIFQLFWNPDISWIYYTKFLSKFIL